MKTVAGFEPASDHTPSTELRRFYRLRHGDPGQAGIQALYIVCTISPLGPANGSVTEDWRYVVLRIKEDLSSTMRDFPG